MPLERVLERMEEHGVLVDVKVLERLGREVDQQLRNLEEDCKRIAARDFVLRSRDQLEKLLFDELKLPVVKRTPKGGRSTDADVLEALAEKHPLPARVLEFRELDKLKGTYIDALPRCVDPRTGRIHTRFDQAVAATGRLSSSEPNLQNIPVRSELGRSIRAAFVAPPGSVILSADYSQIELRVLAHLAHDAELVDAFARGGDVHVRTAALIFDKAPGDVTADERRAAKTINFGVIYGMGENALAKQLGIPREQAGKFIAAYFARYSGVAQFMEKTVETARQGESVRTLLGRRRFLPNLRSSNRALRFEAERVARNTPIQGTAADILKVAMIELASGGGVPGARMVLTVHDELVFEVEENAAAEAAAFIRERMERTMKLDVPLVVDVGWGASWAEAH
jgi:DNA polymerase-1